MTTDKDKASPEAAPGLPAAKTVVGVPALPAPAPARSPDESVDDEWPTAIDAKALSPAVAEDVLARVRPEPPPARVPAPAPSPKPASVAGALPRGAATKGVAVRTPLGPDLFPGLEPERGTRSGVAPQPKMAQKGRSTLLLDGSAPPSTENDGRPAPDGPPIVVPGGATAPQAVTRPPPWGEGAAHVAPGVPRPVGGHDVPEEITGSMLIPDASAQARALGAEELSGSLLLPDASAEATALGAEEISGSLLLDEPTDDDDKKTLIRAPAAGAPASRAPSVKPPVPKSTRPPAHAQRTLLGIPELPRSTPGPDLDLVAGRAAAAPAAPPSPAPVTGTPTLVAGSAPSLPDLSGPSGEIPPTFAAAEFPPPPGPPVVHEPSVVVEPDPPPPPAPMTGDVEVTRLPQSPWATALEDARQGVERVAARLRVASGPGRPAWFLPAVAVGGIVVGVGLVGLLVSAVRGPARSEGGPRTAESATLPGASASSGNAAPAVAPATSTTLAEPANGATACIVKGDVHVLGPSAIVAAGVEVVSAAADVAVGFAPTDHDALAVKLDPQSLHGGATVKQHSRDPIRRATPLLGAGGALSLALDADRKGDRLQGRRLVRVTTPVQAGATADGHLGWARFGGPPSGALWALAGSGPVESIRGAVDGADLTLALAFRQGNAVWMGAATGLASVSARGDLGHVDGLGPAVGSPALAASHGTAMVAWADRAGPEAPWQLRWTRFTSGEAPEAPRAFTPPAGGKGDPVMSPGLAALPGGRFLLLWTEGPPSAHEVRGLTLRPDGAAIGGPLLISAPGVNAGQAQAAFTDLGDGVVGFLQTGASGFEVAAVGVSCGAN